MTRKTKKTSVGTSKLAGILLTAIVALASIVAVFAVQTYLFPQKANVAGSVQATFTLNGTTWTNGSQWDWGIVEPNAWSNVSLNVYNAGNTNDSLVLVPLALPSGFIETWTLNGTVIAPSASALGTLQLYVPAIWPPGPVSLPALEIMVNQV